MRIATAEWADPALVEEKYSYRDGSIWLGRSASDKQLPIGYGDDRHVCLVSGSRGGKGTSSIVNNLCLWPGSAVVVDPKGENATITAARRGKGSSDCQGLGQAVYVLDPFQAAQVEHSYRAHFNPLDVLRPDSEESVDEAGRIADAIVVIHESNDPFWDESARSMVKGLILHILTAEAYEGRRNLITLRQLIMRGDWEAVEALREIGEQDIPPAHGLLWSALTTNPAFGGLVAGIGDTFTNMLLNSPKQYESVLQVANRNTEFIDSPAMQRCLASSDFHLAELKTRKNGMSLYLCLPQRYMSTHYRWLRMMIALTVTQMEIVRGRPATGFPILMVLDEFAGLKRMEIVEQAAAQIAGYGVKLFFVLQSLEQLKAAYKENWETFLSNSGLKIFFSLDDNFSREYVSKLVGETEVIREVQSASDSVSESESVSHTTGTSTSRGTSVSDGTNRSSTSGESRGVNSSTTRSKGRSIGDSWTPRGFLFKMRDNKQESSGRNWSRSRSEGTSKGWSQSETSGTSHGTSESYGSGTSETYGTTHGTSQSRTTGASETIHKRPLVSPDEIGFLFSRIDDQQEPAYPGLALVVISGERTIALRRVNYYEDFQFIGCFEPHPEFPNRLQARDLQVNGRRLLPYLAYLAFTDKKQPQIREWLVTDGQMVTCGQRVANISYGISGLDIKAPHDGLITIGKGRPLQAGVPEGPLFTIMYAEDETPLADPFSEVITFCKDHDRSFSIDTRMVRSPAIFWTVAAVVCLFIGGKALYGTALFAAIAIWLGIEAVVKSRRAGRSREVLSKAESLAAGETLWLESGGSHRVTSHQPPDVRATSEAAVTIPEESEAQSPSPTATSATLLPTFHIGEPAPALSSATPVSQSPPMEDAPHQRSPRIQTSLGAGRFPGQRWWIAAIGICGMLAVGITSWNLIRRPNAEPNRSHAGPPATSQNQRSNETTPAPMTTPKESITEQNREGAKSLSGGNLASTTNKPSLVVLGPGAYECQVGEQHRPERCKVFRNFDGKLYLGNSPQSKWHVLGTIQVDGNDATFESTTGSYIFPGKYWWAVDESADAKVPWIHDALASSRQDQMTAHLKYQPGRWVGTLKYYRYSRNDLPGNTNAGLSFTKAQEELPFTISQ